MPDRDYFPLAAGLVREYRREAPDGDSTVRFEILAVAERGGVVSARCRSTSFWEDRTDVQELTAERRPDGVFLGDTKELPSPLVAGASWTVPPDAYRVADLDARAETPAGTFSGCLRVTVLIGGGDSGTGELLYAPGVGLVADTRRDEASPYRLELTRYHLPG